MIITDGLFDNMVMQRSKINVSDQHVNGESEFSGKIFFRVRKGISLPTLRKWNHAGESINGHILARLKGIPVGGPYELELKFEPDGNQAKELLLYKNILVGDVWVLAGQSNMQGCGIVSHKSRPSKNVRAFYLNGKWDNANDPLNNVRDAVDKVHQNILGHNPPKYDSKKSAGVGLHFGKKMFNETEIPQGLIPCAHGGTSMEQWDPAKKKLGPASLYGSMLGRIKLTGGKLAGILWYQGCSDAFNKYTQVYTNSMIDFVNTLRKDIGSPRLPFVMAQLSRTLNGIGRSAQSWNSIQHQQLNLAKLLRNLSVVPTIDLTLDDSIHLDRQSHISLGHRMALAMLSITDSRFDKFKPIIPGAISVRKNPDFDAAIIKIKFKNVSGPLKAKGVSAEGFSILDIQKNVVDVIYKSYVENNSVVLKTSIPFDEIGNCMLTYGHGTNPYCNVEDQMDRSLPVFEPLFLGKPRPITPFVKKLYLSEILKDNFDLNPDFQTKEFKWNQVEFENNFCDIHEDFLKFQGENVKRFFACKVECKKNEKVVIHLGYDGPVRLWVDGDNIFNDRQGTNPANPSDSKSQCSLSKGTHEIHVCLESNSGSAYGIFLRFERCALSGKKAVLTLNDHDWLVVKS